MERTIVIDAPPSQVWAALTDPASLRAWMFDEPFEIEVDWRVGGVFAMRGALHGRIRFENRGTVLRYEPERALAWSQLSSLSRLPDTVENRSVIAFALAPEANGTRLTLTLANFPTVEIEKHLQFYWGVTLGILKRFVEERASR